MTKRSLSRQRGVAVITALLLTTLAITIVASLFWQQQVQVRSIENQRLQLQKQWILRGALDWSRLILRADLNIDRSRSNLVDHLGEPWAVPLAETRLDQYVEDANPGDVPDAVLSGGIVDAQSRFNLKNLVSATGSPTGINTTEMEAFGRLLSFLQLNPALAQSTAELMAAAQKRRSGLGAPVDRNAPQPMDIHHVDDLLAVQGFTPEMVDKLKEFVVVLPEVTKININTAPAEVLAAKIGTLSAAGQVVALRQNQPFVSVADASTRLPQVPDVGRFSFNTSYFLVNGNVRLNRAGMEMQALIKRTQNEQTLLWIREY